MVTNVNVLQGNWSMREDVFNVSWKTVLLVMRSITVLNVLIPSFLAIIPAPVLTLPSKLLRVSVNVLKV